MSFVANTGKLAGRTLFITSARGIGKTIRKDGAKCVIASQTGYQPRFFGTIYIAEQKNSSHQLDVVRHFHQSTVLRAEQSGGQGGQIPALFEVISKTITPELVKKTQAVYQFNVKGKEEGVWHLDLKNESGSCGSGEPPAGADATLTMDSKHFADMFAGKLKPTTAFMMGKLKISGDLSKAMKLEKLMKNLKK